MCGKHGTMLRKDNPRSNANQSPVACTCRIVYRRPVKTSTEEKVQIKERLQRLSIASWSLGIAGLGLPFAFRGTPHKNPVSWIGTILIAFALGYFVKARGRNPLMMLPSFLVIAALPALLAHTNWPSNIGPKQEIAIARQLAGVLVGVGILT